MSSRFHVRLVLHAALVGLVAFRGALPACADDPLAASPMARAEKLLEDPAKGKEALELLVKLPPEQKQTLDYHFLLASAGCAAGEVREAAEALVTSAMLPASPARNFETIRTRLAVSAKESFRLALQEQSQGKLGPAIKAYLIATKLDPATLGQDDKGLRDLALKGLAQSAAKSPGRADHQYRLGFYTYLFGRPEESVAPFEAATKLQTDPYLRWKNQLWLTRVQRELAEARQAEAAQKKKAKSATVYLPRSAAAPPSSEDAAKRAQAKEYANQRRELEEQIAQCDAEIKYRENLKADGDSTYNWKKVKANLERFREQKKKLEWELTKYQ